MGFSKCFRRLLIYYFLDFSSGAVLIKISSPFMPKMLFEDFSVVLDVMGFSTTILFAVEEHDKINVRLKSRLRVKKGVLI